MDFQGEHFTHCYPSSEFTLQVPRFVVSSGRLVGISGPSGSGKTTLLKLLAGLLVPDAGQVLTGGMNWKHVPEGERRQFRLKHLGFVFQDSGLLDFLSARENLILGWRLGLSPELLESVHDVAEALGIEHLLDRRAGLLSTGERQRVAIGRAMIHRPQIILADEPTGNLDPANKRLAMGQLREACRKGGTTLLVVTHDLALLDELEHRVDMSTLLEKGFEC